MIKHFIVAMALVLGAISAPGKTKHERQPDWYMVKQYLTRHGNYYRIPLPILFRLAESETPWKSTSVDSNYVASHQVGKAGELGPMQIKLRTARLVWGDSSIPDGGFFMTYRLILELDADLLNSNLNIGGISIPTTIEPGS
jgi:hypothetical protein